jgi:hypothetical protein
VSKLDLIQLISPKYDRPSLVTVVQAITGQVNNLAEGRLSARHNAQVSAPAGTATAYAVGDFVPDSNCTVRGSVAAGIAAAYVRLGWVCVAPGTPGTFVEARVLTGT